MGLLDELQQQVNALNQAQADSASKRRQSAEQVQAGLLRLYEYLESLTKQLSKLKPASPRKFALPGIGDFGALVLDDFFIDYRKTQVEGLECFEYVYLQYKYRNAKKIELATENKGLRQQYEDVLWRSGIKFKVDEVRSNERGLTAHFSIPCQVPASIKAEADVDRGRINFTLKNVERFDQVKVAFPAAQFDAALIEELAKLLLGRPSQFLLKGEILL